MVELGQIASSTKTELKAGAIQAITNIIQVEVNFFLFDSFCCIIKTTFIFLRMVNFLPEII